MTLAYALIVVGGVVAMPVAFVWDRYVADGALAIWTAGCLSMLVGCVLVLVEAVAL